MSLFGYLAAAAAGALSHVCYFNRGEHHLYGVIYVQVFSAAYIAAVAILYQQGQTLSNALAQVTPSTLLYLAGLYTNLVIYRLFLHPLNKFPGPFGARLSKLWLSAQLKDGNAFRKVQQLHERYGEFVRVGPSNISITHPKAVNAIFGQGSTCIKGEYYDLSLPLISLHLLRDKALHDQRRRIWSPAFSEKAIRGYEERLKTYRNKLIDQLETFNGQPVNVTKWFNLYTFDTMGDLAFGSSFKMLETSEEHWAVKLLHEGMMPVQWAFPPWFFRMMASIPGLMGDWYRFLGFCAQMLDKRISVSY